MERLDVLVCWFKGMKGETFWRNHDSRAALSHKDRNQDRANLNFFSQENFSFSNPFLPFLSRENAMRIVCKNRFSGTGL
jgi:hypothetical protein